MYKKNVPLNYLQWSICHKTKPIQAYNYYHKLLETRYTLDQKDKPAMKKCRNLDFYLKKIIFLFLNFANKFI